MKKENRSILRGFLFCRFLYVCHVYKQLNVRLHAIVFQQVLIGLPLYNDSDIAARSHHHGRAGNSVVVAGHGVIISTGSLHRQNITPLG